MKKVLMLTALVWLLLSSAGIAQDTTVFYNSQQEYLKAKKELGKKVKVDHAAHFGLTYDPSLNFLKRAFTNADNVIELPDSIATPYAIVTPLPGEKAASEAFLLSMGCTKTDDFGEDYAVKIPKGMTFDFFLNTAMQSSYFIIIEQDFIVKEYGPDATNDPGYVFEYALQKMTFEAAWPLVPAGAAGAVAVIDGHEFDDGHPDGRWYMNYNAVTDATTVYPTSAMSKHGTACAMEIMMDCNNGMGGCGAGGDYLYVMGIVIGYNYSTSGSFSTSRTIKKRAYAKIKAQGAFVVAVSMSFGSVTLSATDEADLIDLKVNGRNGKGIPLYGSTGNAGAGNVNGITGWVNAPASYACVVGCGNSTSADTRASTSNYGKGCDITGCGSGIYTGDVRDLNGLTGYRVGDYNSSFSGTSASTPFVAAQGALIAISEPSLTADQIIYVQRKTARRARPDLYTYSIAPGDSLLSCAELGVGISDTRAALLFADTLANGTITPPPPPPPALKHDFILQIMAPSQAMPGETITISTNIITTQPSLPVTSVTADYRISTDNVWSTNDTQIITTTSTLGGDKASQERPITYIVPSTMIGGQQFYVVGKVDPANLVDEGSTGEGNNTASAKTVIISAGASGYDLAVDVTHFEYVTDSTGRVHYRLQNRGTKQIDNYRLLKGFTMPSGTGSLISQRILVNQWTADSGIMVSIPKAGATYTVKVNYVNEIKGDGNASNDIDSIAVVRRR